MTNHLFDDVLARNRAVWFFGLRGMFMHRGVFRFLGYGWRVASIAILICLFRSVPAAGQSPRPDLPFSPIGSPSRVDQFNGPARPTGRVSASRHGGGVERFPARAQPIRQVAMQSGGFSMPSTGSSPPDLQPAPLLSAPPDGYNSGALPRSSQNPYAAPPAVPPGGRMTPPANSNPGNTLRPAPSGAVPGAAAMPGAANGPSGGRALPTPSSAGPIRSQVADPMAADYQPVSPPQLYNGGYATMADCRLITPPSGYTARSPYGGGCGSAGPVTYAPAAYTPPPAQVSAPAVMPPLTPDQIPSVTYPAAPATVPPGALGPPAAAPAGSLVSFGQETYSVQVGQGLWGQPVAYVPGQRFRNWLRYFSF